MKNILSLNNVGEEIALSDENQEITYQVLKARISSACKMILHHFGSCSAPIPIISDNSVDITITILATQYIGCGYLPINTELPSEKIQKIIYSNQISKVIIKPGLSLSVTQLRPFQKMGIEFLVADTSEEWNLSLIHI